MTASHTRTPPATLPPADEMLTAFLGRDAAYEGLFVTAVHTTGIFCRPTCPARKPHPGNVSFYPTPPDALAAGYRPCRRCRPLEPAGAAPEWLRPLLGAVEADPARRWRDADLRARGLSPARVRRWFTTHHGLSFHAYQRARRLGAALGRMHQGESMTRAAFTTGYESVSGFNEAFRKLFGASPSKLDAEVVRVERLDTPLGPMLAGATETHLCLLEFVDRRALATQIEALRKRAGAVFAPGRTAVTERIEAELAAYFTGRLQAFTVPIRQPGTDFQRAVWDALRRIPYGTTCSYAELAAAVGRPGAVRAVGTANGRNGLAIVVPCHRVIGADGTLTGYGGGLWRKQRLLAHEGVALALPA